MHISWAYPAEVQIPSIAEIVPKSLFLYNYMFANRSLIQYGFCANAKSIGYTMWCEHCLSHSPEMGYFREQSNSENIQKSNTLTIFYFGIPYCTLCLPLLPPTFCMKDAQYLTSVNIRGTFCYYFKSRFLLQIKKQDQEFRVEMLHCSMFS